MRRLHSLIHYLRKIFAQLLQICLLPKPATKRFKCLCSIVGAPVEAPIDKGLDASSKRIKEGGYY